MAKPGIALIAGASSGIGAAYADRLAERGYHLVLVGRNEERPHAVAKQVTAESHVKVYVSTADLTSRADVRRVEQRSRSDAALTLLVNNAGIGTPKRVLVEDVDRLERAPTGLPWFSRSCPGTDLKPATLYAVEAMHEKYKFGYHSLGMTNRQGGVT